MQDSQTISLIRPNYDQRDFFFDQVLDQQSEQETAYEQIAEPVVNDVLNGFNGVVMAYGQTGSGKTHTIFGSRPSLDSLTANTNNGSSPNDDDLHYQCGIVPRCVNHIFSYIKQNPNKSQFRVTVSFLEIYMEQITDLFLSQQTNSQSNGQSSQSPKQSRGGASSMSPIRNTGSSSSLNSNQGGNANGNNLQIREDPKTGIFVHGLTQIHVKSKEQLNQLIKLGAKRRSANSTGMNKNSSRSHAVLQIFVEQRWVEKSDISGDDDVSQNSRQYNKQNSGGKVKKRHFRKALLTIVDLAGSERLSKTGSEGMRLQEAKNINKSIAALSNCISALASEKNLQHVPFRDSKLTRLLTESLGGNCKTTICACISPSLLHYEESYSTLLFATRAMSVRTFVTSNEKIEYKVLDEQGRSIHPSASKSSNGANQQELISRNSLLKEQNQQLAQENIDLKELIKKSQVSSMQTMPYVPIYNGTTNYNSINTNQSVNIANQGQSNIIVAQFQKQQQQQQNSKTPTSQNSNQITRSHSPPPQHFYNPLTAQNLALMANQKSNLIIGNQASPQKGGSPSPFTNQFYQPQFPHQDSDNFFDGQGGGPNLISQPVQKSQDLKDKQMVQKLTHIIDTLQEQLITQTLQIQQLSEENQKLQQKVIAATIITQSQNFQNNPSLNNTSNVGNTIDQILANPTFKQALFEKLANQAL